MPALPSYIPARDTNLNAWLINFSTLANAAPAAYGLTAGDAAVIAADVTAWTVAYTPVTSSATKTATTVAAKNSAKVIVLAAIRPFAQTISLNAGVSSANKTAIGVNPRTSVPTPITTPTTAPVLTAQSTSTAGTIIRYRDATASPSVKAKPYGVIALQIFGKVSTTPITDPATLVYLGQVTKSPVQIPIGPISTTTANIAYFAGRWITKKGLVGPMSSIIQYNVAG